MGREAEPPPPQQLEENTVEQLVAVNPYNPDILPDLENYVNEQVSSRTYSLEANLCLLRFYQFEPDRMSVQIVARILIKALMAMPAPDFSLCLFLVPERVQMEEPFKTLIVLSHFLETGRFRQFWEDLAKNRHLVEAVPGFDQAMQSYAIHVLSLTYQKVQGRGQLIVIPPNEFNHPESKKNSAESIPLDHITRIFPILG
ncbi:hypothetical protein MLD38_015396 [Melastoma candidum]|uniref:Uncharacterized protein n=1 Tax=Melastoma candidum TaxID=119954 RepID=A0ACB9RHB6_9MYRT|nr:hypothetical protein MLD38_015396 [Melastoma candidum]